jgi:hypothetical protein
VIQRPHRHKENQCVMNRQLSISIPRNDYPENPCGEGLGVGVAVGGQISRTKHDPPPQPSPTRGEGADRVCGNICGLTGICRTSRSLDPR